MINLTLKGFTKNDFLSSFNLFITETRTKVVHKNVSQGVKWYHFEKVLNGSDFKRSNFGLKVDKNVF